MQKTLSVINLSAIRSNARLIKSRLGGRKFYAVVKADAYGHGAAEVAQAIEDIADGFCVAIADEGAELRIAGITKPVLVLAPLLDGDDSLKAAFYNLEVTVGDVSSARLSAGLNCHIKINTGMNRYGCSLDGLDGVLSLLDKDRIVGVYSHLYAAENGEESDRQLKAFMPAVKRIKALNPSATAHIAASGGTLRGGKYLLDGVRCGLLLYGYAPSGFECNGLKPALKVYARLSQCTQFYGGGIGYNLADKNYGDLYTYRLGYADGFMRNVSLGERTLCMDAFISEKPPCHGNMLEVFKSADDYAARCGTISYEVLCSVTKRSERIYER